MCFQIAGFHTSQADVTDIKEMKAHPIILWTALKTFFPYEGLKLQIFACIAKSHRKISHSLELDS